MVFVSLPFDFVQLHLLLDLHLLGLSLRLHHLLSVPHPVLLSFQRVLRLLLQSVLAYSILELHCFLLGLLLG